LGYERPRSKYVIPVLSDDKKEILYFDEFPEERVLKTQTGEKIIPDGNFGVEFG